MTNSSSLAEATVQNPVRPPAGMGARPASICGTSSNSPYVYELPFGHGKRWGASWNPFVNAILGGWSADGIMRAQTGAPLNPRVNQDRANVGRTYQRPDATGLDPNSRAKDRGPVVQCRGLCAAAHRTLTALPGQFVIDAPGRYNWDLALQKDFRIAEGHTLQFRAESYNLPNSVQFRYDQHGLRRK